MRDLSEEKYIQPQSISKQEGFDLAKTLKVYVKQWKWFLLSCIMFIVLAFFYLRYATPEYNAYAKIMLVDDENASNPAEAILKDLSKISNTDSEMIEDEIEVLKSRKLMKGVVQKLNLNKQFSIVGRLHDTQFFPNSRAPVKINFISHDSVVNNSNFNFNLLITSPTTFNFIFKPNLDSDEVIRKANFGESVSTKIGNLIITPNTEDISRYVNQIIKVKIGSVDKIAEYYKEAIKVSTAAEGSKVINLSLNDASWVRAKAVINELINEYNRSSIEEKNIRSNNASEFINKRIDLIAADLSDVDDEIERFKTGNKLTNITSEAELYLNSNAQTEQDLANSRRQYSMAKFMKDQINETSFSRIPSNVGLSDSSINSLAQKYNQLLDDRDRLLKSSNDKNPIIVSLDQQILNVKNSLRQSLDNSANSIGLQIRSLENQSVKLNSKIYAVPGQVRKSRDKEREQGVKESLYLYLLQKREEATISQISTAPNAKIIDEAHSKKTPVSPKKIMVYLASVIVGLVIPFSVIYLKTLLDNKIHNKEDLQEEIKDITVLGEIPNFGKKENGLIKKNDRSIMSESFRIIRTNFDYIRRGRDVKNNDNVLFVTSTINSEGKSFVSLNMALTLANTNKRVLLIGADIRNPQIFSSIKKKTSKEQLGTGLTEYLVDKSLILGEAINSYNINEIPIDIMLSGKVPPNPAELLMSDRMNELFESVSKQYDYVIVDTAPSMLVTDTLLISQYAGHTIYVTRAGYTEKQILNFAKELHAENKLKGMMLVVNDVKQSNFGYGAKYGYYGAPKKKGWLSRKAKA